MPASRQLPLHSQPNELGTVAVAMMSPLIHQLVNSSDGTGFHRYNQPGWLCKVARVLAHGRLSSGHIERKQAIQSETR